MTDLNTHGYLMKTGRHKDKLITRVPVGYLTWMVGIKRSEAAYARAELDRRGTVLPTLDISGHAIDRASLSCRDLWHETRNRNPDEGLHAWLVRYATAALKNASPKEKFTYGGMLFVFETDCEWPVLKTVMRDK